MAVPRFADFVTVDLLDAGAARRGAAGAATHGHAPRRGRAASARTHPLYPVGRADRASCPSTPQARGIDSGQAGPGGATWPRPPGWQAQDPERAAAGRRVRHPLADHRAAAGPGRHPGRGQLLALGEARALRGGRPVPRRGTGRPGRGLHRQRPPLHPRAHHGRDPPAQPAAARRCPSRAPSRSPTAICPPQAGVGGDWFDVIPLSGARVALVVGDVVGHGLHAAATMGRLRTAVHNFSALDLPPDELLTHLDDLVARIDQDEAAEADADARRSSAPPACTRSTTRSPGAAPWPGPATRRPRWCTPDGTVDVPRRCPPARRSASAGCPSRRPSWSCPRAACWSSTPTGSSRTATGTSTTGLELLRDALAAARTARRRRPATAVLDALLPDRPSDDVALLVARTRALDAGPGRRLGRARRPGRRSPDARRGRPASWRDWGLEELAFTTELVVSELVTNAIRYGAGPIRLRLIRDRSLICEVSDASSTSPHLRHAADDRRGRPRPVPGRPARRALGHPLHGRRQGHLGGADAAAAEERQAPVGP